LIITYLNGFEQNKNSYPDIIFPFGPFEKNKD